MTLAIASNTRGGITGKSVEAIHAVAPGFTSLRSLKRAIPVLQAYRVIYKDEFRAEYDTQHDTFSQMPSTWIIYLERTMPASAQVTSTERFERMTPTEWMQQPSVQQFIRAALRHELPGVQSDQPPF